MLTVQEPPAPVAIREEGPTTSRAGYPTPENHVRPKVFVVMAAISLVWGGFVYYSVATAMEVFGNHW